MAFRGQSEIHSRLLQDLDNELTDDNFVKLKNHCRAEHYGKFGAGQLEKIKTPSDLLQKLQQKAIFKEGDYNKLKDLLKLCENEDAVGKVVAAENELIQAGHPVVGYPYPGSDAAWQKYGPLVSHSIPQGQNPPPYSQPVAQFYHPSNFLQPYSGPGGYQAMRPQQSHVEPFQNRSDASPSMSRRPNLQSGGYRMPPPGNHHIQPNLMPSGFQGNQHGGQLPSPMQVVPPEQIPNPNSNQIHGHGNVLMMDNDEYYKTGKGLILFINNHFKQSSGMRAGAGGTGTYDYRDGAEKDTYFLKTTCASYLPHYTLDVEEDVNETQFWDILRKAHVNLEREMYSSFILIISSHGIQEKNVIGNGKMLKSESIVLVDEKTVTLDEIKEKFNGTNAPFLNGKPKVFIIQACRGDDFGKGVPDKADCSGGGQAQNLNESSAQLSRPENADVLEAYATSEGTRAWRNSVEGAWYINELCKAISENTQGDHFLDLLLRVHRQIAKRVTNTQNPAKQMPCYVTTFTRKFRLI